MTTLSDIENRAGLARITCGWKKAELPLSRVRRYWRDVHSPAISRRAGIYDYRHYQYDEVDPELFGAVGGGVTIDPDGNVYGGEPRPRRVQQYARVRP